MFFCPWCCEIKGRCPRLKAFEKVILLSLPGTKGGGEVQVKEPLPGLGRDPPGGVGAIEDSDGPLFADHFFYFGRGQDFEDIG